jgi:hypothetical protein
MFAMGALALTAPEASAMLKDPDRGSTTSTYTPTRDCTFPENPTCNTPPLAAMTTSSTATSPSDDSSFQPAQLGASALGGAGAAFAGMWLYRRRHLLAG